MSGTLKELIKALVQVLSSPSSFYPLPDEVQEAVRLYLDKHDDIDEQDSQRLQDELLNLYNKLVGQNPVKQPEFLAVLGQLRPAIRGEERLLQWWKILIRPTFDFLAHDSGIAPAARELLLSILVYEDEDDADGSLARVSESFTQEILDLFLEKTSIPGVDHEGAFIIDDKARLIGGHLEAILVDFGRKKPKSLLTAIDTLLEIKEHRRQALSLLCTFVRFQPPHLYQVVRTSLLDHLLQCLMIDTSTTTISLALLSLVMLLPHIPGSLVPYIPRLFIVYSRLLCWDLYYGPRPTRDDGSDTPPANGDGEPDENSSSVWSYTDPTWDKLQSSFNVADATIRDLTPYFSFLYGLYPENFMGFIRKPNRYLRNARFPGLDRLELDQEAIRRLTERYRRVHLIHPNFYTMTVEAELSDLSRFLHCEPSDIVAQCMGLCIIAAPISADSRPHQIRSPAPVPMQPATPAAPNDIMVPTADTPSQSASTVDGDEDAPPLPAAEENEPEQKRSDGDGQPADDRRSTMSATRDFDSVAESFALRKETQMDIGQTSGDLTSNTPAAEDSPTLPSATIVRQTESPVREMLQTQELLRSMFRSSQAEGNGVESTSPSLAPSSPRLTAYVHSLATMPDRSPAIRPVSADPRRDIVLLQREVLLLRNDLNFERFLKQQHLSHIGQLQRKYIQDATSEADTQNLIQANRALKVKAEEARRAYSTLKKETAAGRSHAKKWESELNGRTRALREQQKRWEIDEQHLRHELHTTRDAAERLRRLLMESESKELAARQKVETLQGTVEELEKMRRELDTLDQRLRAYERREQEFEHARRNEQMAYAQLETARLRLQARDVERERMQKAYEERVGELEARLRSAEMGSSGHNAQSFQAMIDSALASSRSRFENLRRLYNRLLTRHSELEIAYMDLQSAVELNGSVAARKDLLVRSPAELDTFTDDALAGTAAAAATAHAAIATHTNLADPSSSAPASRRATHSEPAATYDEFLTMPYRPGHLGPTSASAPARPTGLGLHDTSPLSDYVGLPELQSSTNKKHSSDGTNFSGASVRSGSRSDHAPDGKKKQKIKPTSGVRVYGRGGVQNIGKKEKEKSEKEKGLIRNGATRMGFRGLSQGS